MWADMWIWWWYDYQWILSLYLFTLMKKSEYILDKTKKYSWKDFSLFVNRMNRFKEKCIKKYWDDFEFKVEILVEWEDNCLDDITFISNNESEKFDNNIFIQVKTKWWDENNTIYTTDWIYKAISNFVFNLNFQKDKLNENISFFIFTNKPLSKSLIWRIKENSSSLYIDFVNYIWWLSKNEIYPNKKLENLHKKINHEIILNLLKWVPILEDKYIKIYSEDYLKKLYNLVFDLKIVFSNLDIIEKIDHEILKNELKSFYWELFFFKEKERISELCFMWHEIIKWTQEFEKYWNYKFTFFKPNNWWQTIDKIDVITKWKFI